MSSNAGICVKLGIVSAGNAHVHAHMSLSCKQLPQGDAQKVVKLLLLFQR